jgi:glutamate racemase
MIRKREPLAAGVKPAADGTRTTDYRHLAAAPTRDPLMPPSTPIVVLDSGLGGLTVARALHSALPHDDILYFGDTARLPYGSKTADTVTTFVKQIIAYLRPSNPRHVVIACNTATALALPAVRAAFPDLSITGVVEPGAKAAVIAAGPRPVPVIGVIATEATIRSRAYERAIVRRRAHARLVLKPAPLLVPIIEEGRGEDDPLVRLALRQYLSPLVKHRIEVLVLGCTHYPILKGLIQELLGPRVRVIDSAEQCAQDVARRLRNAELLRANAEGVAPPTSAPAAEDEVKKNSGAALPWGGRGALRCCVTDDPPRFARLASRFLGFEIPPPTWVSPDELYSMPIPGPASMSVPSTDERGAAPVRRSIPA